MILAEFTLGNVAGIFEEVGSVEFVVAEEFINITVEIVGAGFHGGVQNGSTGTAKLSAEIGSLDFEFLDGVDGRKGDIVGAVEKVNGIGVVVDAVEKVVVLGGPQTVGGKGTVLGVATSVRLRGVYASGDLSEESEIATVERKVVDGLGIDDLADGGALRFEKRSGRADFDGLCDIARLEGEILDDAGANLHDDAGSSRCLKALIGNLEFVSAKLDGRELVEAVRSCSGGEADTGTLIGKSDFSSRDDSARLIGDGAQDGASVHLSEKSCRAK